MFVTEYRSMLIFYSEHYLMCEIAFLCVFSFATFEAAFNYLNCQTFVPFYGPKVLILEGFVVWPKVDKLVFPYFNSFTIVLLGGGVAFGDLPDYF